MAVTTGLKRLLSLLFISSLILCSLLFLPPAPRGVGADGKITIVLDPGHGGASDPGTCRGEAAEKNYTLALAKSLCSKLEANGNFRVIMTRDSDTEITLANRVKVAYDNDADLLFSIHFDGSTNKSANGTTAYTSVFERFAMITLGNMCVSNVSGAAGFKNNGTAQKKDTEGYYWNSEKQWDIQDPSLGILSDYYGIPTWGCKFGITTLLVEHGYFSNDSDAAVIMSPDGIEKLASADAAAIISYYTSHTHTYGAKEVDCPSNCAYNGKSSSRCQVCKARTNVTTLPAAPDNHYYYIKDAGNASVYCDVEQVVTYGCVISENLNEKGIYCPDHTLINVVKPKTEHEYEITYHTDVGHTTDGVTTYKCAKCPATYTDVVPAEGHTWSLVSHTEPTCTEGGQNAYTCSVCGESYVEPLDAYGHSFVRTELIKSETCTEAGAEKVRCSVCAIETEREIPADGHIGELLEHLDSTCAVQGYDKYRCEVCGEDYFEYIEMPEHSYVLSETTALTCTVDEKNIYVCEVCGEVKEEILTAASHKFEETERVKATCESDGKIVYVCSVCKEEKTEILPALGHSWDEGYVA